MNCSFCNVNMFWLTWVVELRQNKTYYYVNLGATIFKRGDHQIQFIKKKTAESTDELNGNEK